MNIWQPYYKHYFLNVHLEMNEGCPVDCVVNQREPNLNLMPYDTSAVVNFVTRSYMDKHKNGDSWI